MKKLKLKKSKLAASAIVVFLLIASISVYILSGKDYSGYTFETVHVEKGSVSNTVTATGTLEATNTVIVGTQVSGVIEKIYVDYNSKVKKGQLIAELDKSTLQSSLENAQADLDNAQAEFDYQKANFERMKVIFYKGLLSESDHDLATYNYKKSEAALKSAKANLSRSERNLSYAMIYSPIDGIVLNRAVEEGQTVAASMNTPELFTITNDLSEMQVEADVDEADIGMVKEGQRVEFTVDAFPDETFAGTITEVRLQPTETSHVITYTVIVTVANPDLKLKPGMTASITDYVEEVNDVLVLPGKAIRFTPERELMMAYMKSLPESERPQRPDGALADGMDRQPQGGQLEDMPDNIKRVWVKEGHIIRPVRVETGVTDGSTLQIISGLNEGDEIVIAMSNGRDVTENKSDSEETQKSPFVPERPRR
jgi:HlyD family secretion protein